ncbi:phage protein, HK97 gp10 family [compost metagenome]
MENQKLSEELDAVVVSVGMRRRRRGQGGGNTFYWWWVELGTEHSRAQPFLRNAIDQNKAAVFKEFISSARFQLVKMGEWG